jgi:hypothetical protein
MRVRGRARFRGRGGGALLIKEYGLRSASPRGGAAMSAGSWQQLAAATVGEGSRNDTVARLAGHLLRRWVDPQVVLELLLAWNTVRCIPPLAPEEITRTVNSICGAELRRRGLRHG